MGVLLMLFAVVIGVLPWLAQGLFNIAVDSLAALFFHGFGVLLLILSMVIVVITRLYRKTSADEAFVRTGMGGQRVISDAGALVIPVVHQVVQVSLRTMRLVVSRVGDDALITGDNLRADVVAEFYIKVDKNKDAIATASTSLGERSVDPRRVKELVFEKLVSALRSVAATKDLDELHSNRDEFAKAVQQNVLNDLKANGLTLETVTISRLDQTPPETMRPEKNVFDAKGARKIAEITQKQRVETNLLVTGADKDVEAQNVDRDKFVFDQQVDRANAEASKDKQVAEAEARAGVAEVDKERDIQVANVDRERAVEVASEKREQAMIEARIEKDRATEIADREKEIQVAQKEEERAHAEEERLKAESLREAAAQQVLTVEVTKSAEREKEKTIIDRQAEARSREIDENTQADIEAYAKVKEAEAHREALVKMATGREEAAIKDASAIRTKAEADKDAATLTATGDKAVKMVPVDVDREQVKVEDARVEVKGKELSLQTEYQEIAKDLEITLAFIKAQESIQRAVAESMGEALSAADLTIWSDPEAVTKLTSAFYRGQSAAYGLQGFTDAMPEDIRDLLAGGAGAIGAKGFDALKAVLKKISPADLAKLAKAEEEAEDAEAPTAIEGKPNPGETEEEA
jgi:uncharacterized membrane protein YqiK